MRRSLAFSSQRGCEVSLCERKLGIIRGRGDIFQKGKPA